MAVPEQTPYIEHTGNGATTSFSLGFQCESKDHLIVLVDEIEPPIATWSLTGGNVVFTTAPAAGKKIKLQRNTPFGRTTNYQSFNNSFRPQTVNIDFDRIWWKLQELGVADWLMKLYVDRLHQQQEQKINDLKGYVDDRDDELRAYLLEEIRKQGVALDQLDEYYNYLMQRLAQIAVDKGWDASFVVDASGDTQQDINDFGGAKWRNKAGGYALGATVKLDNGDIVKSTVANNTVNPNVSMLGWVFDSELLLESFGAKEGADATLAVQKAFNYLRTIGGGEIKTNLQKIIISDVCIYHDNTVFDFNKCKVEFIGSGKIAGAIYNADKTAFVAAGEAEVYYKSNKTRAINNPNARITSNALLKSQSIIVDNVAGFAVGDFIFVSNGYCDMWRVMEQYASTGLPVNRSFQDWVRPDVDLWRCEIAKIKSITGNTIVLEDQLENDYMAVPKTYGFFSDENSRADAIGWNYPTIEKLNGASNCTFKNIEAVNNGATHSIISYLGVNNNILDSVGSGTGQAFEFQTCYNSHMLRNYIFSEKIGQSIRRGSSMCIMANATAHYRGYDATLLIWEGSNLCLANNIIVEGTGGNINHAKSGFYFNTAWNCTGTNIQGKNVQAVVDTSFCRGGIFVDGITGTNCDSLIGSYASFDVKATTGIKKGAYKDSISEYDPSLFYVLESNNIDFSGLKDSTKYSSSKTNGRAHIYKSFAVKLKDIEAENVVLWNSVDDSKTLDPSKYKMKVSGSVFKSMYLTQTYNDGEAQTRRSYVKDTDFMQFVNISNTHNTEFKGVEILGRDVTKSVILTISAFTRFIDSVIKNGTNGIDFRGTGNVGTEAICSQIYMSNTSVEAPTKFLNYIDPVDVVFNNTIYPKSMDIKYITGLSEYPALKTFANPSGNGNRIGWYLVESPFTGTTRSFTTAELSSASHSVNMPVRKWLGCEVYNTTIGKFMKATGRSSNSTWVSTDGLTTITPA